MLAIFLKKTRCCLKNFLKFINTWPSAKCVFSIGPTDEIPLTWPMSRRTTTKSQRLKYSGRSKTRFRRSKKIFNLLYFCTWSGGLSLLIKDGKVEPGNTHSIRKCKYCCTADHLSYWFGFNQTINVLNIYLLSQTSWI